MTIQRFTEDGTGQAAAEHQIVELLTRCDNAFEGDHNRALRLAEKALAIAEAHNLQNLIAQCRLSTARIQRVLCLYQEALANLAKANAQFMINGDLRSQGIVRRTYAATYVELGLYEEALEMNQHALDTFEQLGDDYFRAVCFEDSGSIMRRRGLYDEATTAFGNGLLLLKDLPKTDATRSLTMHLTYGRLDTQLDAGLYPEVMAGIGEVLELARQVGNHNTEAYCYSMAALAQARLGRDEAAEAEIATCLATLENAEAPYEQVGCLLNCGRAGLLLNQPARALGMMLKALSVAERIGIRDLAVGCHRELVKLYDSTDDHAKAFSHLKTQHELEAALVSRGAEVRLDRMRLHVALDRERIETLDRAKRNLEHEVSARTRELREAKDLAEQANRSKSNFLANMSHELRTPLNAILGFSEMMSLGISGTLDPKYQEYATLIHESGQTLLDLINQVLDLSKVEAGRYELKLEQIEPVMLIESVLRIIRHRAEQAGLSLSVRIDPDLPPITADLLALRMILRNLLSNALKFTARGGDIAVRAQCVDKMSLRLEVIDTGIGIRAEDMHRILEPFGQVDNSYTRTHQGTGLGLPLAKSLAELHGGRLEIVSILGKGTNVAVLLPVKPESA